MPVDLSEFSNDKYLLLKTLHAHQVRVGHECYVPLSQQELSILLGFSKPKTNKLMQELIARGYVVTQNGGKGKYSITEDGLYVIQVFGSSTQGGTV